MKQSIIFILLIHFILYLVIGLDVPILRQLFVFIYLTLVPGFALFKLLHPKSLGSVETILFSVGLSLTFLMFSGLLINQLLSFFTSKPLSIISLTIGISLLTLVFFFAGYKRSNYSKDFLGVRTEWQNEKFLVAKLICLSFLPIIALVGSIFLSIPVLMILICSIALLFAVSMVSKKFFNPILYPCLVFSISLALLISVVFTSKYLVGFDVNLEYFVFNITRNSAHWSFSPLSVYDEGTVRFSSCLSITILPTIYSTLSNLSGTLTFKIIYPFIFALMPVGLYQMYRKQVGTYASLASVFFYISGVLVFYGINPVSIDRQIIAEFFLVLSILVWLSPDLKIAHKRLFLMIFGAAIVVSHYSIMLIYLGLIFFVYIYSRLRQQKDSIINDQMVVLFSVMAFLWYNLSYSILTSLSNVFSTIYSGFILDFTSTSARITGVAETQPVTYLSNTFTLAIFVLANAFIVVGLIKEIFRPKGSRIHPTYRLISIFSGLLLLICFVVPNFSPFLNLDRFYEITLLILALFFATGFQFASNGFKVIFKKVFSKGFSEKAFVRISSIVICLILIAFLASQTGIINRITGSPPLIRSVDLDRAMQSNDSVVASGYYSAYLTDENVVGATWLFEHANSSQTILADFYSYDVLSSYGSFPYNQMEPITNSTILFPNNILYLNPFNVKFGLIETRSSETFNISDDSSLGGGNSIIYSNGQVEILYPNSLG